MGALALENINSARIAESLVWGIGQAQAPGTCGELMQGYLAGVDFLINSPIALFADVKVTITRDSDVKVVSPGYFEKVRLAVSQAIKVLGYSGLGATIEIMRSIPRGKGLASSTAEITAAIAATSQALGNRYWDDSFADIVVGVDRSTDAVYSRGISNCSFLTGEVLDRYLRVPSLAFIVVDMGGEVVTQEINRDRSRQIYSKHEFRLRSAFQRMRQGLNECSAQMVAKAATESALINQNILYKPFLDELIAGTREFGALGVNCAHTGTVLGVMYDPTKSNASQLEARVKKIAGNDRVIGNFDLISGGVWPE